MEITGTIKELLEVQSGTSQATGNEWQKQTFVIANNEGYQGQEQIFAFEVFGAENVEKLNKFNKVGDVVDVSFNIRTNEYNGKYYTSLQSWKVFKAIQSETPTEPPVDEQSGDLAF